MSVGGGGGEESMWHRLAAFQCVVSCSVLCCVQGYMEIWPIAAYLLIQTLCTCMCVLSMYFVAIHNICKSANVAT